MPEIIPGVKGAIGKGAMRREYATRVGFEHSKKRKSDTGTIDHQ